MTWLIWMGIVFILILLLILTKITVTIHYHHMRDDDSLTVTFKIWGIRVYRYKVPVIAIDDESATIVWRQKKEHPGGQEQNKQKLTKDELIRRMRAFQNLLEQIMDFNRIMKRFLKHIMVSQFQWSTRVGIGNAAWTGVAAGAIWTIKGSIVSLISHFMMLKTDPYLKVEPLWQGDLSETDLSCMFSFRIGHAMRAGLQIVKLWKGRRPS